MSAAAIATNSIHQDLHTYFQQRSADLQKLGQAIRSGDLAAAQQEYQAIQDLGQSGPFANGDPFKMSPRERAFEAVGKALQSGNLSAAQQAFHHLVSSFRRAHVQPPPALDETSAPASSGSDATAPASGPEIVLNLGNMQPGEQITIGINNGGNGSEHVAVSVANAQGQTIEQLMLNLPQNSNQQIILNLFNSTSSASAQGSNVSLTA
jgi:hypothetical protein